MEPITYDTPGDLVADLRIPSGDIKVRSSASDRTTLSITGERPQDDVSVRFEPGDGDRHHLAVEQRRKGRGVWRGNGLTVELDVPVSTRLTVEGGATDLVATGRLASVWFTSGSGDARIDDVDDRLDVQVASGDLRAGTVGGMVRFHSASGELRLHRACDGVVARTASGDIVIDDVRGDVRVTTVSGDVALRGVGPGTVVAKAVSGDVTIGVVPGTEVYLDLSSMSGTTTSDLPPSDIPTTSGRPHLAIRADALSGDVRVHRSTASGTAA